MRGAHCTALLPTPAHLHLLARHRLWILFGASVGFAILCAAIHHWVVRNARLRRRLMQMRQRKASFNRKLHRALALNTAWRGDRSSRVLKQLGNGADGMDPGLSQSSSDAGKVASDEGRAGSRAAGFAAAAHEEAAAVAVPMPRPRQEQVAQILAELQRLRSQHHHLEGLVQQLQADAD